MKRWITAVCSFDLTLLVGMLKLRTFCVEWLSITVRRFERGIIVGYFICLFVPATRMTDKAVDALIMCFAVAVSCGMWFEQRQPDSRRLMKCLRLDWIFSRTFLALFACVVMPIDLIPGVHPNYWCDALTASTLFFFAAFHYSTSLPEGNGKGGRRRKLAWAKLKEMFGGWLPEPVPEGLRV